MTDRLKIRDPVEQILDAIAETNERLDDLKGRITRMSTDLKEHEARLNDLGKKYWELTK